DVGEIAERQVAVVRTAGRDREAAVPDHYGGDAEGRRRRGERIPGQLSVVVSVDVDDAWSQHEPVGVDALAGRPEIRCLPGDAAAIDGGPARAGGATKAVDDRGVVHDQGVHLGRGYFLRPTRVS